MCREIPKGVNQQHKNLIARTEGGKKHNTSIPKGADSSYR